MVDEIDHLRSAGEEVLNTLFAIPGTVDRFLLVGIANSINMIDEILPRLALHSCNCFYGVIDCKWRQSCAVLKRTTLRT